MSKELALRDYTKTQIALIRRTVAKDCNDVEFDLFVEVCRRLRLDPFSRQIYAFVFNKDNPEKRQLTIVTAIGGYRSIANRSGDYRADNKPARIMIDEAAKGETNPLGIVKAEVSVFRFQHGEWHEYVGEAYWDEFAPIREVWDYDKQSGRRKPTGRYHLDPKKEGWHRMPRIMIAKCAEAHALRKGWPEDLSGVYAEEELHQAISHEMSASEAAAEAERERREGIARSKDAVPLIWHAGDNIVFEPLNTLADKIVAYVRQVESPTELEKFREINAAGLRQFWAMAPGDALEVKQIVEKRQAELNQSAEAEGA